MAQQLTSALAQFVDTNGRLTRPATLFLNSLASGALTPQLFASLPTSPDQGTFWIVSDSTTHTWGATVAGGGTDVVLVWYNGTAFTVIGT